MSVPVHIAIVMDGNRRWAKNHGLPVLEGHRRVAFEILEPLIEYAASKGVKYLTFWAWSTENWKREQQEVVGIMKLFRLMIKRQWARLHKKGVRIRVIGNIDAFDEDIHTSLVDVVEQTKNNKTITVIFALNYGGRDEILRAIRKLQDPAHVTPDQMSEALDTAGIPDPDIIVRTSGEQRLSGFLLWQSEYSELYFPQWFMPEFTSDKLDEVLEVFAKRKRRFGQ